MPLVASITLTQTGGNNKNNLLTHIIKKNRNSTCFRQGLIYMFNDVTKNPVSFGLNALFSQDGCWQRQRKMLPYSRSARKRVSRSQYFLQES